MAKQSLKQLNRALDQLLLDRKWIQAVDEFFDPEVRVLSGGRVFLEGIERRRSSLQQFLNNLSELRDVVLHGARETDGTTYSLFTFDLVENNGSPLHFHEIIQRKWKDGKVIEEQYEISPNLEKLKAAMGEGEKPAKAPAQAEKPKVEKKTASQAKGKKAAADDLTRIEGVGPKIAKLLQAEQINSFADLAAAKAEVLEGILGKAGPRYRIHDPKTWPRQASLAAAGKWEELQALQDSLKGGK